VIDDAMRRAVLGTIPPGIPSLVLAPPAAPLLVLCAERNDEAMDARAFGEALPAAAERIVVEGLDAHADPVSLLRTLAECYPAATLHALIANAAYLPVFAAFAQGASYGLAHPYVRAEIAPAFADAGWSVTGIDAALDGTLQPGPDGHFTFGAMTISVSDPAMLDSLRAAAYLVAARTA